MQVGLAALPDLKSSPSWLGFVQMCRWIVVVCIVLMALLLLVMPLQYGLVRLSKAVIGVVDSISRAVSQRAANSANQAQPQGLHEELRAKSKFSSK